MGHKVNPIGFRLGYIAPWSSRWFDARSVPQRLKEDVAIRDHIAKKLKRALIERIDIERTGRTTSITIFAARPGLLIGRGGGGAEEIRKDIIALTKTMRSKDAKSSQLGSVVRQDEAGEVRLEVQEAKTPEANAAIVCQQVAEQLEKRMPFRRILKRTLAKIIAGKEVKGAKLRISGRLGGAEMSRSEELSEGAVPLHTLRANIDYAHCIARTTHGVIGVKVWVYVGDVFGAARKNADSEPRKNAEKYSA